MNLPYRLSLTIITPATDTYAVRAHKIPDRFRLKKRLHSSSFPRATPALQYSPKLTAKLRKLKPTVEPARIRHSRRHSISCARQTIKDDYLTSTAAPASASSC